MEGTVTINYADFLKICEKASRADALMDFTGQSDYSIAREDVAAILGFELPAEQEETHE